jgi:hypothetical protein
MPSGEEGAHVIDDVVVDIPIRLGEPSSTDDARRRGARVAGTLDYVSSLLNAQIHGPAPSVARGTAKRRKIVTQVLENEPSRTKMAQPSAGSAIASAAMRRALASPASPVRSSPR